jgi:hypothetical protein
VAKPPEPTPEILPAMNDKLFNEMLDRIANGSSLLRLEKEDGFPARSTMWRFISATEERRAAYEQARQDRADYRVEMMDGIIGQIHSGKMEPNTGRGILELMRWQASKENNRKFGEQSSGSRGLRLRGAYESARISTAFARKTRNGIRLLDRF